MKKIFSFGRKKKEQPLPGNASLPSPAGAYKLRQKDLSKLHRGAASGDLALLWQGLRKHGIDARDKAQRTPLHLACANGHVDVVTYLVENNCELNLLDNDYRTPLMKAVQCQQEKCVAILLANGAEPNLTDADGNSALHLAAVCPSTSVAQLLIEHSATVDAPNKEQCTPLHLAVSAHQEEMVEFLLKEGANVHAGDQWERTPLMTAASEGELNLIQLLLHYGADVSQKDADGWTAEDHATIRGYSSVSKYLAEHAEPEKPGEASAGVLSSPQQAGAAGLTLGAPAVDMGGIQGSPSQTSRTGKSRKAALDDFSEGDSVRSSEKVGTDDSWHTSEEEELDFTPKKLQKPNLTLLMKASQKLRRKEEEEEEEEEDGSVIESLKSPKKSLKPRTSSDAELNRAGGGELLNPDASDASNLEEEEMEEEEEEEEHEENDSGSEEEGEEEEEEEEEEEDHTQDEKEEEDLEDEETRSHDILEEKQGRKTEPKGEMSQKLECFSNAKLEGEDQSGTGEVCDDEKVEESADTPVSFIAGCYEKVQENLSAMAPKIMNNEVSCKPVPKQAVCQSLNNLQGTQGSWNRKSMLQEKSHRDAEPCFAGWDKEEAEPPSDSSESCALKDQKSSFSDAFDSGDNSWSATTNLRPESHRLNSGLLEPEDDEEQDEETDDKACEALKQGRELMRCQKNVQEALPSRPREESPAQEAKEEEQEKEDTSEELQAAEVEAVEGSVGTDSHRVHNASGDSPGERSVLPAVGAEEGADSPWDSETDAESPGTVSPSVLPAAERHGACSQGPSGEHSKAHCQGGCLEKPSNCQLKTPTSALEMNEASPEKRQEKSDVLEEFGLGEAEDIEGDSSGSSFHMSSSAGKEDLEDAMENSPVQDNYGLETATLTDTTAAQTQPGKAQSSPQEALAAAEELPSADKQCSPKPWEERYERLWVENEKRQLKTHFKSITAELKQLFGEVNATGKSSALVGQVAADGFSGELRSSHASSQATAPREKAERKSERGALEPLLGGKVPKMEIVIPCLDVLHEHNNLRAEVEGSWSGEEDNGTKVPLAKGERRKMPAMEVEENGSSRHGEGSPEHLLRHSLKTSVWDDIAKALPQVTPVSTRNENAPCVTERKPGKEPGCRDAVPRDCLLHKNQLGEVEMERLFASAQQPCGMLEKNLDEELNQDLERFKSKVEMLQTAFLALEKEKVQLQKEVEKEKSKERCPRTQTVAKQDHSDTAAGNTTNQQVKEQLTLRKEDALEMENESTVQEKDKKNSSSEERAKRVKTPVKGPPAKTRREKEKARTQMDDRHDLDFSQSSDTASENVESATAAYREALLLLEQFNVDQTGSAILWKIQNILLEYEQRIEHDQKRYAAVCREVRRLEREKEAHVAAEETQELKSLLAHQEAEWKSDIQSLKFTLRKEEEKRLSVETLYEKTREKLRSKEDQYCKEMEEKRQLELHSRNTEIELTALKKLLKQVEEERDETERQLSQEKSARALQEGLLNNHLCRQKELQEEARRSMGKNSEESATEREKDLLYKNQLLQDDTAMLRLELDQVILKHQEEKGKYSEENETLRGKNEDLQKELKLNEEALTQTTLQYNVQLSLLKTEAAVLTSKLEQTKESRDRLETEMESFCCRLKATAQELERQQAASKSLSQQLSTAESKANSLENELHQVKQTLREKTLLLEMTQKELSQAQCQLKESDHARQLEKEQVSKSLIKQESMQERLAQLQSENLLLRQQLEDVQNKGILKEKVVSDVQDRFNDIFNKLRADAEKQVSLVEERNKELNAKCSDLREQVFKHESDKAEREGLLRQLQQELADALKKQSMSEASLEVSTRYRSDLEEDKVRLHKELEKVKAKVQEMEEQHLQSEHSVQDLKTALDNKEREAVASSQKLQDLLLASSGANTVIKQLEEHVQSLEIENARLEATVQQQSNRIDALQKDLQASSSVHGRLEDLISSLQTAQAAAEEQHQQQGEKEKRVKKEAEWKRSLELRLELETRRNTELQEDSKRLKKLLSRAVKKAKVYEEREVEQGDMKSRCSELASEAGRLRTKVSDLSQQLEIESKKCVQLEVQNQDLREKLSTMNEKYDKLEKSKCQLQEEVATLRHRLESSTLDHSQMEQYKREVEEKAGQEIRQKLQEINVFLQIQAASQDRREQIRASHHASLRNELKHRIRDVECELNRIKTMQQDSVFQKETKQAEVEYKELYLEEAKIRRRLENKLERAHERLAEAHGKLLQERYWNKSLITSSIVTGGLAANPVLYSADLSYLGNSLALSRGLSQGATFLSSAGDAVSPGERVRAYVAKVQQEMDEKITKELEKATAELEPASADGSSRSVPVEQDSLSRAVQEYREVLTKNHQI